MHCVIENVCMKSTGRSKKRPRKYECFATICLTPSQDLIIRDKAAKAGLSLSGYLRKMAIDGEVRAALTDEQWQYVKQLVSMSNSLNQLVGIGQQKGTLDAFLHFELYRDRIDKLLNLIHHAK